MHDPSSYANRIATLADKNKSRMHGPAAASSKSARSYRKLFNVYSSVCHWQLHVFATALSQELAPQALTNNFDLPVFELSESTTVGVVNVQSYVDYFRTFFLA